MNFSAYTYIDVVLGIPLLWGIYKGFTKGFIIEIASIFAIVLAIWGAVHLAHYSSHFLVKKFDIDSNWLPQASFVFVFLLIVITIFLLAKLLETIVNIMQLGIFNKLAGAVFGFLKYALLLSVLIYGINNMSDNKQFFKSEEIAKSKLYAPLATTGKYIMTWFKFKK